MELTIDLTGTAELILHNSRLANPLDQYTLALKQYTKKRTKTDEDLAEAMTIEARGGCYETIEGNLGIPTANVYAAIHAAAKLRKLGTTIKRALLYTASVEPLLIGGLPQNCDEWVKVGNVDVRSVVVSGRRIMRARPIIPAGWTAAFTFELLDDVMDARELLPVLEDAGRLVGLCEMRPAYGRFVAEVAA